MWLSRLSVGKAVRALENSLTSLYLSLPIFKQGLNPAQGTESAAVKQTAEDALETWSYLTRYPHSMSSLPREI